MLHFGPFRLDTSSKRLWRHDASTRQDQLVNLAPKALELLGFLVKHSGQVLTRDQLFEAIWPNTYVDDHALSVQIRDLRKALGDDPKSPSFIETRHRLGYCFVAKVDERAPAQPAATPVETHAPHAVPPEPEPIPETHYTVSGDVNIAYQVIGDGPVDLIFVMGWVSHLEYFWTEPSFARFLKKLASFSRLILFDKRGTGLSDRVPLSQLPTIEQRMYDLRAIMDAVKSERAVICGVSEGGPMSAVFAATYPERTLGLIMIGTYAKRIREDSYPWGPTPEEHKQFVNEIRNQWGGPVGIEARAPSLARDPKFRDWWARYLRTAASPGAAVTLTQMNGAIDVRQILPSIQVPTLVIHRSEDMTLRVEEGQYVASLIPGARFVELPGADHLPFVGDQDAILTQIEEFTGSVNQTRGYDRTLATVLDMELLNLRPADFGQVVEQIRKDVRWFRALNLETDGPRLTALFDGPARAVRCACEVRDHVAGRGLRTRAGLHTGECDMPLELGIRGPAVEVARAICEKANPGDVLASDTVRDLVAGSGLNFKPLPERQVRDVTREWRLFEVNR